MMQNHDIKGGILIQNQKIIDQNQILIVDGPYIDMSPATQDLEIFEIVKRKVLNAIQEAHHLGAKEVIFLSNYIPNINVAFYDDDFLQKSISF